MKRLLHLPALLLLASCASSSFERVVNCPNARVAVETAWQAVERLCPMSRTTPTP